MKSGVAIYDLNRSELEDWMSRQGEPQYRAGQIMHWLYRKRVAGFAAMSNLSEALRGKLAAAFRFDAGTLLHRQGANDTTQKFLFGLAEQAAIETVLIPASTAFDGSAADRKTLCVSTQVGCAFGCKFCASGLEGWVRNLSAGEIVQQIMQVEQLSGERIDNLVFMGMGEPLANYQNVLRAVEIINAPWGIGIGARHITISTSGLVPRIRDLADQPLQVRLAVSLHGATDEVRNRIMPINERFNLVALREACRYWRTKKKQRLTFEYILIEDINDQREQAERLAVLAVELDAKINLIPYNHVDGLDWTRPSQDRQNRFLGVLRLRRADATIRREKGHEIEAACGQLRLRHRADKAFAGVSNVG